MTSPFYICEWFWIIVSSLDILSIIICYMVACVFSALTYNNFVPLFMHLALSGEMPIK